MGRMASQDILYTFKIFINYLASGYSDWMHHCIINVSGKAWVWGQVKLGHENHNIEKNVRFPN